MAVIVSEQLGAISRYGRLVALSGPGKLRQKLAKALHAKYGAGSVPAQLPEFQ